MDLSIPAAAMEVKIVKLVCAVRRTGKLHTELTQASRDAH